ncbi:MAG: enoyl-CoA hydratase/isomerase family protein [Solirubrobacterales bacterium]
MATIETERDGRVLTVLIENPPHNFMTGGMVQELDALTRSLRRDRSVGAVVITGKPEGLFLTHYDVAEILDGVERVGIATPPWLAGPMLRVAGLLRHIPGLRALAERTPLRGLFELYRIHDIFLRMNRMDKVFIAAINGPATGGGCELALACDVRYMADAEIPIGLPEMTIGFNPGAGGTQRLPRALGAGRALEMMLEGRTLTPAEAAEVGLVHAVLPPERLREAAGETARRMARRAPQSVRALKRAIYDGASGPLPRGLAVERKWFLASSGLAGSKRGMAAYAEEVASRGPTWAGFEEIRPWQEGTAADLVDGDASD